MKPKINLHLDEDLSYELPLCASDQGAGPALFSLTNNLWSLQECHQKMSSVQPCLVECAGVYMK